MHLELNCATRREDRDQDFALPRPRATFLDTCNQAWPVSRPIPEKFVALSRNLRELADYTEVTKDALKRCLAMRELVECDQRELLAQIHSRACSDAEKRDDPVLWRSAPLFAALAPLWLERIGHLAAGLRHIERFDFSKEQYPERFAGRFLDYQAKRCAALERSVAGVWSGVESDTSDGTIKRVLSSYAQTARASRSYHRFLEQVSGLIVIEKESNRGRAQGDFFQDYCGSSAPLADPFAQVARAPVANLRAVERALQSACAHSRIWADHFEGLAALLKNADMAAAFPRLSRPDGPLWNVEQLYGVRVQVKELFASLLFCGPEASSFATVFAESIQRARRGFPIEAHNMALTSEARVVLVNGTSTPGVDGVGAFCHSLRSVGNLLRWLDQNGTPRNLAGKVIFLDGAVPFSGTAPEAQLAVVLALEEHLRQCGARLWLRNPAYGPALLKVQKQIAGGMFGVLAVQDGVLRALETSGEDDLRGPYGDLAALLRKAHYAPRIISQITGTSPTVEPGYRHRHDRGSALALMTNTSANYNFIPQLVDLCFSWLPEWRRVSLGGEIARAPRFFESPKGDDVVRALDETLRSSSALENKLGAGVEVRSTLQSWFAKSPQLAYAEFGDFRAKASVVRAASKTASDYGGIYDPTLVTGVAELAAAITKVVAQENVDLGEETAAIVQALLSRDRSCSRYHVDRLVDTADTIATLYEDYAKFLAEGLRFPKWSAAGGVRLDASLPLRSADGSLIRARMALSLPGGAAPVLFIGENSVGKTTLLRWLCFAHQSALGGSVFPGEVEVPKCCARGVFGGGAGPQLCKLRLALEQLKEFGGGVLYLDELMLPRPATERMQQWLLPECLNNNIKLICNSNHPWSLIPQIEATGGKVVEMYKCADGTRDFRSGREIQYSPARAAQGAIDSLASVLPAAICARAREILARMH